MKVNNEETGPVTEFAYNTLYGMQTGAVEDEMGWTQEVK
ncbi:hypothetical protein Dip510_001404 [Elusimicrobium posterum]